MGDHHPARVPGRAGGVLQHGQVVGAGRGAAPVLGGGQRGAVQGQAGEVAVAGHGRHQRDVGGGATVRQDQPRRRILDHSEGALVVAAAAVGRRSRHGDHTGVQAGQKGDGEPFGVRLEDQYPLPGEASVLQPGRQAAGRGVQLRVVHPALAQPVVAPGGRRVVDPRRDGQGGQPHLQPPAEPVGSSRRNTKASFSASCSACRSSTSVKVSFSDIASSPGRGVRRGSSGLRRAPAARPVGSGSAQVLERLSTAGRAPVDGVRGPGPR